MSSPIRLVTFFVALALAFVAVVDCKFLQRIWLGSTLEVGKYCFANTPPNKKGAIEKLEKE